MNEKLLEMIRDKLNAINENSLYSTPVEYANFLADPNKVADTFMFSFLGVLGAFSGARDKNQIIPYFKKEKKLPVYYNEQPLKKYFRADFICYDSIVLELNLKDY